MNMIVRVLVALVGVFGLVMGLRFLTAPMAVAQQFAIVPEGILGMATLRADFTSFFGGAGAIALYGAWRQRAEPLLVPMLLFALAIMGRAVSLMLDGAVDAAYPPMIVEAVMIAILYAGYRQFRR